MIHRIRTARTAAVALTAVALVGGLTACANNSSGTGSSGGGTSAAGGTYTFWDPYPQFDESSDWVKLIESCGTDAGVTVKRTGYDTSDLTNKALLAGQQGASPDVLLVDNPVVSTLASAGILTDTATNGLDTADIQKNIIAAGEVDGKTYGLPIGANTLALYYNEDVLKKAGVDPSSVTDWTSLTAALKKIKAAGDNGITFSAIGTEEGSFQFLPWFWGSGADLTQLDSGDGVSALALWTDWLKSGYTTNSVIQNTQTTAWQDFETGKYGFVENGTWQLANAAKLKFKTGVINIPSKAGGSAPAPTGGEFLTLPVQKDTARYATTKKIVDCLTNTESLVKTDNTLSYVAPTSDAQAAQVKENAALEPWVSAVAAAKGRTSDNLGTKYPKISEQLWGAVQEALSGSKTPAAAMQAAQTAAANATK